MRNSATGQQRTAAVLVPVAVLVGLGGGYARYRQTQMEARLRTVQARRTAAEATLRETTATTAEDQSRLAVFMAPEQERQAFTDTVRLLESRAKECKLDLSEIKPLRPVTRDGATKQLCALTVEGGFDQVVEFLRRLEDHQRDAELYRLGLWAGAVTFSMPSAQKRIVVAQLEIARLTAKEPRLAEADEPETVSARVGAQRRAPAPASPTGKRVEEL